MAILAGAASATELLAKQWHIFLAPALVYAAVWFFQTYLQAGDISKIPFVGTELGDEDKRRATYMNGAKGIYLDGYRKFKNGIYRITTPRTSPVVVVDTRFLSELKDLPDDHISFSEAMNEHMHAKWTNTRADRPLIPHVVKKDLTPALNRLNPTIAEEVDLAFREELPPCKDFTPVPINQKLLRIVAKVSGRIFIGPELCRSEEYVDMAINYTMEVVTAQQVIHHMKPWQRFLFARSVPQVKALQERAENSRKFLEPMIAARRKAAREDPDFQRPDDIMQWLLDGGQAKFGEKEDQELTEAQLSLTFAAIHTTTMATTNAFYSIAAIPEFIPELREEIRTVLKEYGTFTTAALQKMKKLDSFLREVMRVDPLGWNSFTRKVLKPVTLSNGQVIPVGCVVEVASHCTMNDPSIVADPDVFDPLRFYKMREQEGLEGVGKAGAGASNQFVSVNTGNLTFGYGRHACPGRFFAANEIKMIMGRALLDYDVKLLDGVRERYQNIQMAETNIPDPTKELLFKRVAV